MAAGLAIVLAAVEGAAIAGLAAVINAALNPAAAVPGWAVSLGISAPGFAAQAGAIVFGLLLLRSLLGFAAARLQALLQAQTDAHLGIRIFGRTLEYPYADHLNRSSSEFIAVLGWCVADVAANLIGAAALLAVDVLLLVALATTLITLQPLIALGMIAYFGLIAAVLLLWLAPKLRRVAEAEQVANRDTMRSIVEGLHGVKAFQIGVATRVVADEHATHRQALARSRQKKVFYSATSRQLLEASVTVGVGLLAAALFLTGSSGDAAASLGLVVAVAFRALPSLSRLLNTLNGVRSASVSLDLIVRELKQPTRQMEEDGDELVFHSHIELRGITFHYDPAAPPALRAVNLRIPQGTSLGIVGASGSGKTTLVDVLLGLLDPSEGEILIDDIPLSDRNILAWRRQVGYVPQDAFMLDSTVRDNVAFSGRAASVDDKRVWRALQAAELAEYVAALPQQLDSVVGERGARMSGGQRQRLGIARALYRQASVLVLDEATAALDLATEAAVSETLSDLDSSITQIVIAHRLSTVKNCDLIAFFDKGSLVALGTFAELRSTNAAFSALAALNEGDRR